MIVAVDWSAVSAIATVLGVPLAAGGLLIAIRKNRTTVEAINRRVTTPDTVTGTIGEEVANVANRSATHEAVDDARFARLWQELGKPEPGDP
jgi:hypothetical protein